MSQWPWQELNFTTELGLTQLTTDEIYQLKYRLSHDDELTKRYLTKKLGYNPDDPKQLSKAMWIYEDFGIINEGTFKSYTYLCLMSKSLVPEELEACY